MSVGVDEIVEIHLKNGLKNVNRTMNAFMIYRKNCALQNSNLSRNDVSKLAGESWKNESDDIKNYYERMAENVKKEFKEKVTSLCFIHSNLTGTNDNEINTLMDLNPITIRHYYPLNIDSSNPTYYDPHQNSPNIDQNTSDTIYHNHTFIPTNIYSSQQTYPYIDQKSPGITFPDASNMDQISPDINQGTSFYNFSPSNSFGTIYSRQQSS